MTDNELTITSGALQMTQYRVTRCGSTTFAIGQLFDPNDLIDPRNLVNPAERVMHLFDGLGMAEAYNEEAADAAGAH